MHIFTLKEKETIVLLVTAMGNIDCFLLGVFSFHLPNGLIDDRYMVVSLTSLHGPLTILASTRT